MVDFRLNDEDDLELTEFGESCRDTILKKAYPRLLDARTPSKLLHQQRGCALFKGYLAGLKPVRLFPSPGTRAFAGVVLLALRPTTCSSSGLS
jgi:hypothetical protein